MTPNETLQTIETKCNGLSAALICRYLHCEMQEAKKMLTQYKQEKELLRETMQLIYDLEDGRVK